MGMQRRSRLSYTSTGQPETVLWLHFYWDFSLQEGSVHKHHRIIRIGMIQLITIALLLLALGLNLSGCGSSAGPASGNINGAWTATLSNTDGSIAYRFSATFAQATGTVLNVTNLAFTSPGACLLSNEPGAQGSFTPTTEAFGMSMVSPDVGGPMLNLQGTLSNGKISGTWSASSVIPPCTGNGNFTIQPSMAG